MEQLINFIIRPPRAVYNPTSDLLDQEFMLKGEWFQRKDLEVVNNRGNVLQCSHYMPLKNLEGMALPCVIYCHGNSGCRADASEAAIILLPSYITVFTLDFSGSGLSEGEHVTLGCNEKDDLKVVVNHLRADGKTSCIGLWGRSMGAVTSLMYGVEDPSIAGMVLDSPFSNLIDLMMELVDTTKFPLPKFTVKYAIHFMRKAIQRKAKFDIMDLDTIQVAKCCFVPALLGHAMDDDFIQPHHSDRIYDSYAGDKNIIKFEGDHNSPRPQFYFDSITIFFHNVLHPPKDASGRNFLQTEHDISDKGSWDTMHGMGYIDRYSLEKPFLKELATSSTEDAITHLRSRKPHMSKTEVPGVSRMQEKLYESEEIEAERSFGSSDVPGLSETDDYFVEHAFDGVTYFPCDIEDENRMIMAAVLESLKDLETGHALENPPPDVGTTSQDTSPQDNSQASTTEYTKHTAEANNSTSASNVQDSHREPPCTPDLVRPGGSLVAASSQYNEASAVQSSTGSDISATGHGSSDGEISAQQHTDMAGEGHANQAVQRGPTNHIMSGLAHRWGLNFFRNSE